MLKIVISKRRRLYVKKYRSYNLIHIIFPRFYDPVPMAVV